MKVGINTRLMREKYQTGIQTYIDNLTKNLKNLEGVTIVELSPKKKGRWEQLWFDSWGVRKEIRERKIEVFHSPSMVLPEGHRLCPYVVTVHDLGFLIMPEFGRGMEIQYFSIMMKRTEKLADRVIVDSEVIKNELCRFYPDLREKVRVVPLGVDEYFGKRENSNYLRTVIDKYGLTEGKTVLVGSAHSPRKNVRALIAIWDEVRERVPGVRLLVCGTVGEFTLKMGEGVIDIGFISKRELRALYQSVDLFIYPSLYEGFGLPILEAMRSGCLLVASNLEVIRELGVNKNCLFNPLNHREMKEKICSYLEAKVQVDNEIQEHQRLALKYSWKEVSRKTMEIYQELL